MLRRVVVRTLRRRWLDGLVKAYMHSLTFSAIVHQGGRSVAECGPVVREMGGVGGLSVYITQNSGRSACLPIYGDHDFLVFGDVLKRCYYLFARHVCEVAAPYVCVSSYFV
jgi:hypothetical protein